MSNAAKKIQPVTAHTPGKLRGHVGPNGSTVFSVETERGLLSVSYGGYPEQHANALRIIACWNACEGIADPGVVPELIAALREALPLINRCVQSEFNAGAPPTGTYAETLQRSIKSLLAKAEGR